MSEGEMESNGALILPAGTETISTPLSESGFSREASSRDTISLYIRERDYDGNGTKVNLSSNSTDEALRMYPPFSGGLKRKAGPGGGTVSDYFVPAEARKYLAKPQSANKTFKTVVGVYSLAAYSSSANFAHPE
ncbi:MAG: hypothetical protein M1820_002090 [Bogoriella megaspora]|nr:MAG: hypothetical protein M1820_002090 [Bogoriella megaspora]